MYVSKYILLQGFVQIINMPTTKWLPCLQWDFHVLVLKLIRFISIDYPLQLVLCVNGESYISIIYYKIISITIIISINNDIAPCIFFVYHSKIALHTTTLVTFV